MQGSFSYRILLLFAALFWCTSCSFAREYSQDEAREARYKMVDYSKQYVGVPYKWGGTGPDGMDCSGFTQMMYRIFGIQLPRDASEQVKIGKTVDFLTEAQAGDLAFFENKDHKIIHVGMLMDNQSIMHASGRVKINRIDATGIVSEEDGQHTHQLRIIKRII